MTDEERKILKDCQRQGQVKAVLRWNYKKNRYILSLKKVVLRWNYENNRYEPWQVSPNVALFKENLEEIVDCCECGKQVKYGDCFTSLRVHNHSGFGYAVCEKCYEEECKEEEKYEGNDI